MSTGLFSELVLRSGVTLRNRIAKAAMEDALRRYRTWLEARA
jgi:2,4-dienoyl-CoA reductase-like NADH-dependent reductase (Old Yellow Enzyme family)